MNRARWIRALREIRSLLPEINGPIRWQEGIAAIYTMVDLVLTTIGEDAGSEEGSEEERTLPRLSSTISFGLELHILHHLVHCHHYPDLLHNLALASALSSPYSRPRLIQGSTLLHLLSDRRPRQPSIFLLHASIGGLVIVATL